MIRLLAGSARAVVALCRARLGQATSPIRGAARTGARDLQGGFDTSKGAFVIQVTRDMGAAGRRPLLQSGQERLLQQRALLPRDPGLHGAVRHRRRSCAVCASGARRASRTTGCTQSNKRGFVTYAHGRAEHPHQPVVHQLRRQRLARPPGIYAVRPGDLGHGRGRQDQRRVRRRRPRGRGPDQGRVQTEGNAYLSKDFPRMDFVRKATIER